MFFPFIRRGYKLRETLRVSNVMTKCVENIALSFNSNTIYMKTVLDFLKLFFNLQMRE